MKYLSVKEVAEKWEISEVMIRKYCTQKRIPGAKQREGVWVIPSTAEKPVARAQTLSRYDKIPPLACKLCRQKTKKIYHGLYDYVQINLAYSSNRMASNRLTRKQVESIFRKGKVQESFEPMKVSDIIEVLNHRVCTDYILDNLEKPLSVRFIKQLHQALMYGTVDDRLEKVFPGEYRNSYSARKETFFCVSSKINEKLLALIDAYESLEKGGEKDIIAFHGHFERVFPFEDGNGRVGRLIMFKECLRHDITPFIIDDKRRTRYLQGLREWDKNPDILMGVIVEAQDRFKKQIDLQNLGEYRDTLFNQQEDEYDD